MQCVEIGADNIGIEDRRRVGPQQHRHFAEGIFGVDARIAQGRTGLVMNDLQPIGNAGLMGKDERLAREG